MFSDTLSPPERLLASLPSGILRDWYEEVVTYEGMQVQRATAYCLNSEFTPGWETANHIADLPGNPGCDEYIDISIAWEALHQKHFQIASDQSIRLLTYCPASEI
jgi:hypothetical protein